MKALLIRNVKNSHVVWWIQALERDATEADTVCSHVTGHVASGADGQLCASLQLQHGAQLFNTITKNQL